MIIAIGVDADGAPCRVVFFVKSAMFLWKTLEKHLIKHIVKKVVFRF